MNDLFSPLMALLNTAILPSLETIQKNQTEQRQQYEFLHKSIEELRVSLTLQLIEVRTSLAEYQTRLEDLLAVLHDGSSTQTQSDGLRRALNNKTRFN